MKHRKKRQSKVKVKVEETVSKNVPLVEEVVKPKKLTTSKIICSKCKKEKKTTKDQMEKLVAAFGSLELVHKKYHCIECRKNFNVRKDGRLKPVKQKRVANRQPITYTPHGTTMLCRPKCVSSKKWNEVVKEVIKSALKQGIIVPVG